MFTAYDVDAIAFAISPEVHATDERSLMGTLEIQAQVVAQARVLGQGVPVVVSPVRMRAHAGTPFADAWTIGSIAALAGAEVASITCDTSARAVGIVAELGGRELAEVSVSHPDRIAALAVGDASDPRGSITMIVANLTPSPQAFRLGEEAQLREIRRAVAQVAFDLFAKMMKIDARFEDAVSRQSRQVRPDQRDVEVRKEGLGD